MEQAKEKIIADLYALRAGLSVISEHTDEIKKKESVIQSYTKTEEEISLELSACQDALAMRENVRRNHNQSIDTIQGAIREVEQKNQEEIEEREKRLKDKKWCAQHSYVYVPWQFWLVHIITFISSIVLWYFRWSAPEGKPQNGPSVGFASTVTIVYVLTILIVFIIKKVAISKTKKRLKDEINGIRLGTSNFIAKRKEEISDLQKNLQTEEEKIAHTQAKAESIKERLNQCVVKNKPIKEEQNRQIQAVTEQSKLVKASLNAVCDSWIAESDWGNVDLLIYYLESRRADTLKEALHHLDQQKQTDQIVNAISEASTAIQSSIHSSTMRLATALEESFTLISKQLKDVSNKMGRFTSVVEEGQRIQQAQSDALGEMGNKIVKLQQEQLSTTELNKALLEKANQSSETLLNDLRYNQRFWIK